MTATADPSAPITESAPLAGFTVAVTAARRRQELAGLLARRGAKVVMAPAIRIVSLEDDTELLAATHACLTQPPDIAVATTGIGFRGWMEAADGWGLGDGLREQLRKATLLARGPKARGAIRAAGLVDAWSPPSESSSEVLEYLLDRDLDGKRLAVQLHGEPLPDFVDALRATGADVVEVPVYRWELPADVHPVHKLVDQIISRQVDAVTFTSAPAVASLVRVASDVGAEALMLAALNSDVVPACVGPVTGAALERHGVATVQPQRARLGALVREVVDVLPGRCRPLKIAGQAVQIRGYAAVVDGEVRELAPAPMAVLRALAQRPGVVVPRADLLGALPGAGSDEHAVEMAVNRIRSALGSRAVQTVVKRGYRLAYDPDIGRAGSGAAGGAS